MIYSEVEIRKKVEELVIIKAINPIKNANVDLSQDDLAALLKSKPADIPPQLKDKFDRQVETDVRAALDTNSVKVHPHWSFEVANGKVKLDYKKKIGGGEVSIGEINIYGVAGAALVGWLSICRCLGYQPAPREMTKCASAVLGKARLLLKDFSSPDWMNVLDNDGSICTSDGRRQPARQLIDPNSNWTPGGMQVID